MKSKAQLLKAVCRTIAVVKGRHFGETRLPEKASSLL